MWCSEAPHYSDQRWAADFHPVSRQLAPCLPPCRSAGLFNNNHKPFFFKGFGLSLHFFVKYCLEKSLLLKCPKSRSTVYLRKVGESHREQQVACTQGRLAATVLRLAGRHQQLVIGPRRIQGVQDGRRENMTQPYPVISSGASCHREEERVTPIMTAAPLLPQHLLGSSGGPTVAG